MSKPLAAHTECATPPRMTPRASRIAELTFGPVSLFVKLFPVASEKSVSLSQVHGSCGGALKQQYVCASDSSVVRREEIARQYRHADGTVTALTAEDLKVTDPSKAGTLEVLECIPEGTVDPIYLGKTMLLGKHQEHDLYGTFVDALARTRTSAVCMHYTPTRDQLVLISRYRERQLLLRELYYAGEIRALDELEFPATDPMPTVPEAAELWVREIERCRKPAFNPEAYEDGYPARLRAAAEQKASASGARGVVTKLVKATQERKIAKRATRSPEPVGERPGPASVRRLPTGTIGDDAPSSGKLEGAS